MNTCVIVLHAILIVIISFLSKPRVVNRGKNSWLKPGEKPRYKSIYQTEIEMFGGQNMIEN